MLWVSASLLPCSSPVCCNQGIPVSLFLSDRTYIYIHLPGWIFFPFFFFCLFVRLLVCFGILSCQLHARRIVDFVVFFLFVCFIPPAVSPVSISVSSMQPAKVLQKKNKSRMCSQVSNKPVKRSVVATQLLG